MLDDQIHMKSARQVYGMIRAPRGGLARLSLSAKDAIFGYLFISPQLLGFLAFILGPSIAVFVISAESWNLLKGHPTWVGLQNYATLAHDPLVIKVLTNSLIFAGGAVPLNIALALSLALLLYRELSGMTFFRTLFFAPVVTSTVAWVLVWNFMLQHESGTINQLLALVGIQGPNWLHEPGWAMFWVIAVRVVKNVGLNMVILLAALKDIPQEYMEAAKVDGANSSQTLFRITIPLLAPTLLLVMIITLIGALNVFDHILLLTNGGPGFSTFVLAFYVYFTAFKAHEVGYASALASVLFMVSLGLAVAQWVLRRRWVYSEK